MKEQQKSLEWETGWRFIQEKLLPQFKNHLLRIRWCQYCTIGWLQLWGLLPSWLHSELFPQISSQILHFLPARLAGWNNQSHPDLIRGIITMWPSLNYAITSPALLTDTRRRPPHIITSWLPCISPFWRRGIKMHNGGHKKAGGCREIWHSIRAEPPTLSRRLIRKYKTRQIFSTTISSTPKQKHKLSKCWKARLEANTRMIGHRAKHKTQIIQTLNYD